LPKRTPTAQQVRARMNKWDCIKLKSFYRTKEINTDKGLITRIYKKLKN
jgi:hypothetical protein